VAEDLRDGGDARLHEAAHPRAGLLECLEQRRAAGGRRREGGGRHISSPRAGMINGSS
jgi:hypothetical protein